MSHFVQRRVVYLLGMLAMALALLSCSGQTRYKVLSFFLDGVPPPNEFRTDNLPPPASAPTTDTLGLNRRFQSSGELARGSRHAPFAQRQCKTCHDSTQGFSPREQTAELCDQCHGERRRNEGWNHGPINENNCSVCHHAHESPNAYLLTKPMPELCLFCHEPLEGEEFYHPASSMQEGVDLGDCIACHDGHRVF